MESCSQLSRRRLMQLAGATALGGATPAFGLGMPQEGPDTPKLTMYMNDLLDPAEARRLKQIGITWIDTQAVPGQPWGTDYLQPRVDALAKEGMKIGIMMVRWSYQGGLDPQMSQIVFGGPNRDAEIDKSKQTIVNCGKLGIPVVEWNFYNHRATEGYASTLGRGDSGMSEFKFDRMKDLPPLPAEGVHDYDSTWRNLEYFLKAVVPVAEKNNVVLSVHPNDPPSPKSRGSAALRRYWPGTGFAASPTTSNGTAGKLPSGLRCGRALALPVGPGRSPKTSISRLPSRPGLAFAGSQASVSSTVSLRMFACSIVMPAGASRSSAWTLRTSRGTKTPRVSRGLFPSMNLTGAPAMMRPAPPRPVICRRSSIVGTR